MNIEITGYKQQMDFINCQATESAFVAGLYSGKTYAGAEKALDYCLKHPYAHGIITAPTNRVLEEAVIPTYTTVFPYEFISNKVRRPYNKWGTIKGNELHFWSTDNAEAIIGANYAFAHMDEASRSTLMAYKNVKARLRQVDKSSQSYPIQLWISTTPKQLNWLYKEIHRPKDPIVMFTASTKDNKFRTEEQIEQYIGRLGLTPKEYEQDIEGKFVLLSGDSLISMEILTERLNDCLDPLEVRDNGTTQIWKHPVVGVFYVAGADCADEGGGGVNDLIIQDPQTGEEMAEINADIPADRFAMMCFELCKEYNWALLAPERNGTSGGQVIQKLKDMGYDNLYIDDKGKEGWYTSSNAVPPRISRFTMLLQYEEAVRLRRTVIRSSDAIGEMSTFVRDEGEKYKPREGSRSDRVMARAICWQLKNSRPRNKSEILSVKRLATTYA